MQSLYSEGWGSFSTSRYFDFSTKNYYLNKAIILISDSFKNGQIVEKDLKDNVITDGPLTKLLTEPNFNQTFEELSSDFIRNLLSGGFTYLLPYHENTAYSNFIEKDSELRCLNNDNIDFGGQTIKMFQKDISFGYTYNSEKRTFNYSEVIPFFDISQDPKNSFRGISRLKSLEDEINQIWLSNKAIDNQIKLSGNIIVSPDASKESPMSTGLDKQITNLPNSGKTHKDEIEEKLNLPGIIFGKSLTVASTALKAINLAESLKDYDYNTKFKQEAGRTILNLYGIPRKLQNIITTSELKSDKEGEDVDMYEKIVIPIAKSFTKSINSTYSEVNKTKVELDYSHLSVFAEKRENAKKLEDERKASVSDYVKELVGSSIITQDEGRKILKDEKVIN